ncbi:unannotated protein [freshwater metagenome]|uniref:Unannotated protein n=1 Tax=freshwater metagenome TaxID=449393 RepID=A0A6J7DT17_9ZZZZ
MMMGDTSRERLVVMTLTTPFGTPASSRRAANASVVSGVSSAGLMIAVHPAAIAGATFRVAIAMGKFHGVMRNDGPTGRFETIIVPVPSGFEPYRPLMRTASSENQRRNSPPYVTSP